MPESIDPDTARRIGEVVNDAMVGVINVPQGDKFQVITRHASQGLNLTTSYLGIPYSDKLLLVQITLSQGRSIDAKKALFKRIAEDIAKLGLRKEDVFINLVEVARENWSFGNGEMQYAPASDG
jgi:phenylpyruvate tautomerase PptA (4-oxalocrotonate tautomerase family)